MAKGNNRANKRAKKVAKRAKKAKQQATPKAHIRSSKDDARMMVALASEIEDALHKDDRKLAKVHLARLKRKYPKHPDTHFMEGVFHFHLGHHEAAVQAYHLSLALAPDAPQTHYNLAQAYKRDYRFEDMIRHFERVIELKDAISLPPAGTDYDIVMGAQGYIHQFTDRIEAVTGLDVKSFCTALTEFRAACDVMDDGEWEKAIAGFQRVLAIHPNHAQSLANLAGCHRQLKQVDIAMDYVQRALEIDPDCKFATVHKKVLNLMASNKLSAADLKAFKSFATPRFVPAGSFEDLLA